MPNIFNSAGAEDFQPCCWETGDENSYDWKQY